MNPDALILAAGLTFLPCVAVWAAIRLTEHAAIEAAESERGQS